MVAPAQHKRAGKARRITRPDGLESLLYVFIVIVYSIGFCFRPANNRLDLEPAVANLAHDSQLVALTQFDETVSSDEARAGKAPSHWVVLARRWEDLRALTTDGRWHALPARPDKTVWTDDFSNVLEVIKWR